MCSQIFSQAEISGIKLKNRIIRSATHEGMADERGCPTEQLKTLYCRLAQGGVGAIITGYAGIQQSGKSSYQRMLMVDNDSLVDSYRNLVAVVHEFNTPIILQIAHCGRQTRSKIIGHKPVAPSAVRDKFFNEDMPKELTDGEIEEIINNFVNAVERAKKAGFDGVQLHLAHGYLLSEFLSPYMNRRKDKWGGSTENRYRIVAEIFKRAKSKTADFPILAKINGYDGRRNGMTVEEAVKIAKLLQISGCCAIEVSCGVVEDGLFMSRSEKNPVEAVFRYNFKFKRIPYFLRPIVTFFTNIVIPPVKPLRKYNVEAAMAIKKAVSIPVIVVGGIESIEDIADVIENKKADFVSMCRPFILEPDIVKKFKEGKQSQAKCIYCNYCTIGIEEESLRCYLGKLGDSVCD